MSKPSSLESLAELRTKILDQMTDALIAIDRNGRIAFWNRGAERLCHLSARDALGKLPKDVHLSPWLGAEEKEAVLSAPARTDVWRREAVRPNGNGNTIHLESSITALIGPDGESAGVLVVVRDITNMKRKGLEQEQRIEGLRRALDRLKVLESLIPVCSHCKQIRDEDGSWHEPEVYLREQFQVKFTHGICPACVQRLHPDYFSRPAGSQ
jgi:PAS domain S-box-containing protein